MDKCCMKTARILWNKTTKILADIEKEHDDDRICPVCGKTVTLILGVAGGV